MGQSPRRFEDVTSPTVSAREPRRHRFDSIGRIDDRRGRCALSKDGMPAHRRGEYTIASAAYVVVDDAEAIPPVAIAPMGPAAGDAERLANAASRTRGVKRQGMVGTEKGEGTRAARVTFNANPIKQSVPSIMSTTRDGRRAMRSRRRKLTLSSSHFGGRRGGRPFEQEGENQARFRRQASPEERARRPAASDFSGLPRRAIALSAPAGGVAQALGKVPCQRTTQRRNGGPVSREI